jgi:hypothetical protein
MSLGLVSGPFCHNEEHLTDPTTAERPPKGVRSGYRKSVNQATVVVGVSPCLG